MERGLFLNQGGLSLEQSPLIFKRVSWAKAKRLMMSPPFISSFLFLQKKSCFDKEKRRARASFKQRPALFLNENEPALGFFAGLSSFKTLQDVKSGLLCAIKTRGCPLRRMKRTLKGASQQSH